MTTDAENLSIIWNPYTESWAWSNPEGADTANTLVSDVTLNHSSGAFTIDSSFITVSDATTMEMVVEEIDLLWNGSVWDWNEGLKNDDITLTDASTVESDTTPDITVLTSGSDGAATLSGTYTLTWDEGTSTWSATSGSATIGTVTTLNDGLEMIVYSSGTGGASTIEVSLDEAMTTAAGQTISFTINSTPPEEYVDAVIMSSGTGNVIIDFDGDASADVTIQVTAGASTALVGGESFTFDINPDTPPAEYSNATLTGDATYCSIDLDGSGNEDDKQDIIFTFEDELKSGSDTDPLDDRSVITFDIEGSTAWRTVTTDEAEDTGYYQFTTDFLGGQFGVTETDISFNIGSKFDGNNWVNDSLSSTQYATSSSTTYQDADGYASGDLTGISVDASGLVSGTYSNGQEIALFMVALADFNNVNGLQNEGGNLYSATTKSGAAITNKAGDNGLGSLSSYALEMSNVDISEEFVSMIELQNAYEANAKIISTVDEMMSTVIGMKR
jgi:flagellar hook protein FlgE